MYECRSLLSSVRLGACLQGLILPLSSYAHRLPFVDQTEVSFFPEIFQLTGEFYSADVTHPSSPGKGCILDP